MAPRNAARSGHRLPGANANSRKVAVTQPRQIVAQRNIAFPAQVMAIREGAARSAALATLLRSAELGRVDPNPAMLTALFRLAAAAAIWSSRAAEMAELAAVA